MGRDDQQQTWSSHSGYRNNLLLLFLLLLLMQRLQLLLLLLLLLRSVMQSISIRKPNNKISHNEIVFRKIQSTNVSHLVVVARELFKQVKRTRDKSDELHNTSRAHKRSSESRLFVGRRKIAKILV